MDSRTLPYHWDDRGRLHSDYQYLGGVYERCLDALCPKLNALHGIEQSQRFWRIVVGPWLRYFIEIFYDRYLSIRAAGDSGLVSETWIADVTRMRPPLDFTEFNHQFISDSYNQYLYSWLIEHMQCVPFRVNASEKRPEETPVTGTTLRDTISQYLSRVGRAMPASCNRIALLTTQLPHSALIRLSYALRQYPWFASPAVRTPIMPVDRPMRQKLALDCGGDPFEKVLEAIIPEQLPIAHLEGFRNLRETSLKSFPPQPEQIVTSAAESFDEGFKVWAATCADKGSALSISQHGGFFGSGLWMSTESHQVKISDRYYSWGWSDETAPSINPMPALKLVGVRQRIRWSDSGQILWALTSVPRWSYRMLSIPVAGQFLAYLDDQFRFAQNLPLEILKNVTLRLYPDDYGWNEELRWRDRFPDLRVYKGNTPMDQQLSKSSLFVGTYNATTFLETLAADFPTILFWNPEHWELRPAADPFYNRLQDAGIFHTTPESAAGKLEEIWTDPMKWWKTPDVQRVREEFCNRFARTSENWMAEWTSELSR